MIGIGVVMGITILLFNNVLANTFELTCGYGPTCEIYSGVKVQVDLIERLEISKEKMTCLLNKLEAKQIIERKVYIA